MNHRITITDVLRVAEKSECVRRKYGAILADWEGFNVGEGYNARVSPCCNGVCVRDELAIEHGRNTDAGAEIHAEQAALVYADIGGRFSPDFIYVAGLGANGSPMNGFDNSPCYSCSRMIKYAGIRTVFLPVDGAWEGFSIEDIMETWERGWR